VRAVKVTLEVFLDVEDADDEELRAAEGYIVDVVREGAEKGILPNVGSLLGVRATGYDVTAVYSA